MAFAPQGCYLEALVAVTGSRWHIKHAFKAAKQEVGLDNYEVRSAYGWYRHVTLALWAWPCWPWCGPSTWRVPPPKKESGTAELSRLPPVTRPGCTDIAVTSGWHRVATTVASNHNQLTYNCSVRKSSTGRWFGMAAGSAVPIGTAPGTSEHLGMRPG